MPRSVKLFAWILGLAGLLLLLAYTPTIAVWPAALGLALFAGVFEHYTLTLPNRVNFSLGSTFVFLAFAEWGVGPALLVEAVAAGVSMVRTRTPVQRSFNLGQLLLAVWAMHLIDSQLVARSPAGPAAEGAILIVDGLVFFAVNALSVSTIFRLMSRKPFRTVLIDVIRDSYVGMIGSSGLFLPLLYTFRQGGWMTLILGGCGLLAFRYAVNLYLREKRSHLDSLRQMATVLERRVGVHESHASRVASLAKRIAEALRLGAAEVDLIHAAAILHDVGEAEVEPRIIGLISRKAMLTLSDMQAYRRHPELGEALVRSIDGMDSVAPLIRHHHECWDGSGYPDGLKGEAIPMGARILRAAEAIEDTNGDVETKIAATRNLAGTVIDPRLLPVLDAAVRKAHSPAAQAAALVDDAKVSLLEGKLLQTVRSSQLLKTLGVAQMLTYCQGSFTNFLGQRVAPPAHDQMVAMAHQVIQSQLPARQHVVDGRSAFDVYAIPGGEETVSVLLFDITEAVAEEREQTRRIFRAYRDVINVATKGKLMLIDDAECGELLAKGDVLGETDLTATADGGVARAMVSRIAADESLDSKQVFHLTVCVSEAVTNVFKHAGAGHVSIRRDGDVLRVIVTDRGGGIPLESLPRAILMDGYSTQHSMGRGYSVMLRLVDRIWIRTCGEGTVVVLERQLPSPAATPKPDRTLAHHVAQPTPTGGNTDVVTPSHSVG